MGRTGIAAALIVRGAVEVPAIPTGTERVPDAGGMRLRETHGLRVSAAHDRSAAARRTDIHTCHRLGDVRRTLGRMAGTDPSRVTASVTTPIRLSSMSVGRDRNDSAEP
jgi:hypothetical protein